MLPLSNEAEICAEGHEYEPTCRWGYFHEIVYDIHVCNMWDRVKTERWRQLIFVSR